MTYPRGDLDDAAQRAKELIAFADAWESSTTLLRAAMLFPGPSFSGMCDDIVRAAQRMRATGDDVLRLTEEVRGLRRRGPA